MGYAVVCVTAAKANTSGGTFADSLSAQGSDSLNIAVTNGKVECINMWGIDSDSVAELEVISTRPESTHDQLHGIRFEIASLLPGGAAAVAGHNLLGDQGGFQCFSGDTLAFTVTSTAADDVVVTYQLQYDDLPGADGAAYATWDQVKALRKSTVGINSQAQASGTPGAYGTARALNADDARLHAGSWYALLGWTVQTAVTSITLTGPDWSGQRIGGPAGVQTLDHTSWFADQSVRHGMKPLIPCFQALNAGSVNVQVADGEASTTPKIDFLLYELTSRPGF
jgi:hypothetical protein